MKKININFLGIELTRKCNLKCSHCMRGDSQEISISNKTLKSIFNNSEWQLRSIDNLFLSGGEPTLAVESLKMIYSLIKQNNISVRKIYTILNGTIYNEEFITTLNSIMELYNQSSKKACINISFSNDIFHPIISKKTFKLYKTHNKNKKFKINHYKTSLNTDETGILNLGHARKNNLGYIDFPINNYFKPLEFYNDDIFTIDEVYINAKGFILKKSDGEYDAMDKYNLGNINECNLLKVKMIEKK